MKVKVLFYLKIIILQFLRKGDLRIHAGEAEKEMVGMKILKIETSAISSLFLEGYYCESGINS